MKPDIQLGLTFLNTHPVEAARILERFPAGKVARFLAQAKPKAAARILEELSRGFSAACLEVLDPAVAAGLFAGLHTQLQVNLLRQLDRSARDGFLSRLPPELAGTLQRLLPYSGETAGALMEPAVSSVPHFLLVRHALKRVKRARRGVKFYVYVTDDLGRLTGVVSLHELLNAPADKMVGEFMHAKVASISAGEPLQNVSRNPYWQRYHALPVTGDDGVLLGVLRQRKILAFLESRNHADLVHSGVNVLLLISEWLSVTLRYLVTTFLASGAAPVPSTTAKPSGSENHD